MLSWRITQSSKVNGLSGPWPILLYTWLISHCDNLGRFHGEPEQVKSSIFPRRKDIGAADVEAWLQELADSALILWYEHGGMRYLAIPPEVWNREQRLTGNMRNASDLPECTNDVYTAYKRRIDAVCQEMSEPLRSRSEVEVEVEVERNPRSPNGSLWRSRFTDFWQIWPHRVGKVQAEKAWNKLKGDDALFAAIAGGIPRLERSRPWQEGHRLHPATFLNNRRWEDEDEPPVGPKSLFQQLREGQGR